MKIAARAVEEVAVVSDPSLTTGIRQVTATSSKPNHPILLPDADSDDDALDLPALSAATASQSRVGSRRQRSWSAALRRPATYLASGLGGAVVVTALYVLLGSRTDAPAGRPDVAPAKNVAPGVAMLDRRADTLATAVAAFTLRGRMYDSRRMGCDGLSRGLQQVEDAWLAYSLARKEAMDANDGARDQRDQALFADVRAVEQRFERSSCTRP